MALAEACAKAELPELTEAVSYKFYQTLKSNQKLYYFSQVYFFRFASNSIT